MDASFITGRENSLFQADLELKEEILREVIGRSKFLVIGGAGTIGQATVKEIFRRDPKHLSVVDISENNLVELVRDLRSSFGYGSGIFETYAVDCGSSEFGALVEAQSGYDFVLNFSAMKHVRSESDPFTLMRLIQTNILNTVSIARLVKKYGTRNYFCVSTDKAANPVNMMGASKRIMELYMMRESLDLNISMARFANVAFSDGSLLHGFNHRLLKNQPLSAPNDVKRYFVSQKESGELCLLSTIFGDNLDVFFPKLSSSLHLKRFSDIAKDFLASRGLEPFICDTEDEARQRANELSKQGKWPCYFFESDTTGEKDFEEFYTNNEKIDWTAFETIGVIKNEANYIGAELDRFEAEIRNIKSKPSWGKAELVKLFLEILPSFEHLETGKYLDNRM